MMTPKNGSAAAAADAIALPPPPVAPSAPKMQPASPFATVEYETKKKNDNDNENDNDKKKEEETLVIRSVPTKMNYVTAETGDVHIRRDVTGCDSGFQGATWDAVDVNVYNARLLVDKPPTLDHDGYQLLIQQPQLVVVEPPPNKQQQGESACCSTSPRTDLDFFDTSSVIEEYYPHCEELLRQVLGSTTTTVAVVKAFDHNIRSAATNTIGKELNSSGGGGGKTQEPIGLVHGDYTDVSGPRRVQDLACPPKVNDVIKERSSHLLDPIMVQEALQGKRRFALINVWRSIDPIHPVQEYPLACIKASTVTKDNFRTLFIHYADRVGENYLYATPPPPAPPAEEPQEPQEPQEQPQPQQPQWYYFPQMTYHEALLIKQWDSSGEWAQHQTITEGGRSTFAMHSAFVDPTSPSPPPPPSTNSIPRQSIEVRCVVLYEPTETQQQQQ